MINKAGIAGDKECLNMIQESLPHLGLSNILIELGSAAFFNRLCSLVGDNTDELKEILKYRDISKMKRFVAKNNFDSKLNSLLLTLPTAFGSLESLEPIIANIDDEILQEAMKHLKELYNSLDNRQ